MFLGLGDAQLPHRFDRDADTLDRVVLGALARTHEGEDAVVLEPREVIFEGLDRVEVVLGERERAGAGGRARVDPSHGHDVVLGLIALHVGARVLEMDRDVWQVVRPPRVLAEVLVDDLADERVHLDADDGRLVKVLRHHHVEARADAEHQGAAGGPDEVGQGRDVPLEELQIVDVLAVELLNLRAGDALDQQVVLRLVLALVPLRQTPGVERAFADDDARKIVPTIGRQVAHGDVADDRRLEELRIARAEAEGQERNDDGRAHAERTLVVAGRGEEEWRREPGERGDDEHRERCFDVVEQAHGDETASRGGHEIDRVVLGELVVVRLEDGRDEDAAAEERQEQRAEDADVGDLPRNALEPHRRIERQVNQQRRCRGRREPHRRVACPRMRVLVDGAPQRDPEAASTEPQHGHADAHEREVVANRPREDAREGDLCEEQRRGDDAEADPGEQGVFRRGHGGRLAHAGRDY